jgi:hypothetical protein
LLSSSSSVRWRTAEVPQDLYAVCESHFHLPVPGVPALFATLENRSLRLAQSDWTNLGDHADRVDTVPSDVSETEAQWVTTNRSARGLGKSGLPTARKPDADPEMYSAETYVALEPDASSWGRIRRA